MRAAKWPFRAFQANVQKAQALAMAQQYLNEFLRKGSDKFIESWIGEAMAITKEIIGFDIMELVKTTIQEPIKKAIEAEMAKRIPREPSQIDEETAQRAAEKFRKLAEPIISISTLEGQTLLEQAVVLGVTAYETYITDSVESILRLNTTMVDRFSPELQNRLDWEKIKKHGKDWLEAATAIILEQHNAFDLGKVQNLFLRLANLDDIFGDEETEKRIRKFIEHRHIIVHHAGRIDRKFGDVTGSRQGLGTTVELTTTYVTEGLEMLSTFVRGTQEALESLASGSAEAEPPQ